MASASASASAGGGDGSGSGSGSGGSSKGRFASQSYAARATNFQNAAAKEILAVMERKQTNLCVSVDVTTKADFLAIVEAVGPDVAMIKSHIDILEDFDMDLVRQLTTLSKQHDFVIFEDRKFADIGNTVTLQYASGVHKIASWSHITNAHLVPGPGIIAGLGKVGKPLGRGLLLLAEMSSAGTLARGDYSKACVEEAIKDDSGYVMGFIAMSRVDERYAPGSGRDFLVLTPGVGLDAKGDSMGQQYRTPAQVIGESGCDVIIVGRGIYGAVLEPSISKADAQAEVRTQCTRYRQAGWEAYLGRIQETAQPAASHLIARRPYLNGHSLERTSSQCRPFTSEGVSVVFGYGSLIFKPPPYTVGRTVGYIKGYARRFAQSSNDHRGTHAKPGRVATLVCATQWHSLISNDDTPEGDIVWGVAWHIDPSKSHEVRQYLDDREKNGYTAQSVTVFQKDAQCCEVAALNDALIYVGLPDNEAFVGPARTLRDLAEYIFTCEGPSGRNDDYVLKLAVACRALSTDVRDSHLFTLEGLLLEIRKREGMELSLLSGNDKCDAAHLVHAEHDRQTPQQRHVAAQ